MKKSTSILENDLAKALPDFSKSWLPTQGDSMKCISDCTTVVSEIDFMEERPHHPPDHDLETSFRKQATSSCLEASGCNPNSKKSRVLVVESRIIPEPLPRGREGLRREEEQLQSIERKTQDLVAREREQRKQLKKLKKLYVQKVQELVRQQEAHLAAASQLNHQIDGLNSQKTHLLREKDAIYQTMTALEGQVERTKEEIRCILIEKQHLTHRIELFDANFQERSNKECCALKQTLLDLNRRISIIDGQIGKCKRQGNKMDLNLLLEVKIQLLEERQKLKVKEEGKRQERLIIKLNEIISSRNNLLNAKNRSIFQLENGKPSTAGQNSKDKQLETADSFFSKTGCNQNAVDQAEDEEAQQWDGFKQGVRALIESNRMVGHEESYEAIESIVLGMIHLFENETCCEEDVLQLLDISLDSLNSKYASKARGQISKIQKLLSLVNGSHKALEAGKKGQRQKENCQSQDGHS